jgi:4-diphosphocytidyl-2-C-methyl-D-erythritol kinase
VALGARYGRDAAVHVHIDKDIPVAGGMAGGSADGAAALVACDALWGTGASRAELLEICAELGSDVPFSLVGGAALGVGRGELLTPLEVEGRPVPEPVADESLLTALAKGDVDALAGAVSNDLQPAALSLFPELADTLRVGREAGAAAALVSGSGPTTAYLARDAASAARVAEALTASGACRDVRLATGPAPGATVV